MAWHEEDDALGDATDEDNDWDHEDWDEAEDDAQADLISCSHCGHEVHEEAQFCPSCEECLSEEDTLSPRKPWWMLLGGLAAMGAALTWLMG